MSQDSSMCVGLRIDTEDVNILKAAQDDCCLTHCVDIVLQCPVNCVLRPWEHSMLPLPIQVSIIRPMQQSRGFTNITLAGVWILRLKGNWLKKGEEPITQWSGNTSWWMTVKGQGSALYFFLFLHRSKGAHACLEMMLLILTSSSWNFKGTVWLRKLSFGFW